MSDDILKRLLRVDVLYDKRDNVEDAVLDAIDEIERLRATILHLYFNEGVCYGDNCDKCETVYGLVRDESTN